MKLGFNEANDRFCKNHSVMMDLELCEKSGFDCIDIQSECLNRDLEAGKITLEEMGAWFQSHHLKMLSYNALCFFNMKQTAEEKQAVMDELDDIIRQGKDMGVYFYIYTGGEPLVRKKDIITLCERHPDCEFLSFTNGTLIDEAFADEMLRVKNFIPAISLEGDETTTDSRRGAGTYQKVLRAIDLLHERKLIYGISSCYTSVNWDAISSREYFQKLIDLGCLFIWYFHYMPVGNDASPELLPTPEQRIRLLAENGRMHMNE